MRIKEVIEKSKYTQKELAKITGLNKSTISRFANGKVIPKLNTAFKLADALEVDINEFREE